MESTHERCHTRHTIKEHGFHGTASLVALLCVINSLNVRLLKWFAGENLTFAFFK